MIKDHYFSSDVIVQNKIVKMIRFSPRKKMDLKIFTKICRSTDINYIFEIHFIQNICFFINHVDLNRLRFDVNLTWVLG